MPFAIEPEALATLWKILQADRRDFAQRDELSAFEVKLVRAGAEGLTQLSDHVGTTERRVSGAIEDIVEELAATFGVATMLTHRPARFGDSPYTFVGTTAFGAAKLLIDLEHLGLQVNPEPLVKNLLGSLQDKQLFTPEEMAVLCYEHERGARKTVLKADLVDEGDDTDERVFQHTDSAGYQFTVTLVDDLPRTLEIVGPHYTEPLPRELVVCEDCQHRYVTNEPREEQRHSEVHAERMAVLKPCPHPVFSTLGQVQNARLQFVDRTSPQWMHQEVRRRAEAFKREQKYDWVQWPESPDSPDFESFEGYLFVSSDGTVTGACGFYRQPEDVGPWRLDWVWLAPGYRRQGILQQHWKEFRTRYGDFEVAPPFSDAMRGFLLSHGSPSQVAAAQLPTAAIRVSDESSQ